MRTQSAKIIPYPREEVSPPQKMYVAYQKKADDYQFSLDKPKAILLSISCAALGALLFSAGLIIGFMRPLAMPERITMPEKSAARQQTAALPKAQKVALSPEVEIVLSDTENMLKNLIELSIQKSDKKSSPKLFFSALNKSFWNKKDESGLIRSFIIPTKDAEKVFQKKYFALILEVFADRAKADERLKEWKSKERKYNPYLLEAKDFGGKSHFVLVLDDYDDFEKVKAANFNTQAFERKSGLIAYMDTDKPLRQFGVSWEDDDNIARPYTLRIASFRTQKEADNGFRYYTGLGLSPYMVRVFNNKSKTHQWVVYTGPYRSKKEALAAKKQLPKTVRSVIRTRGAYANYIESFSDEAEAEKMCKKLLNLRHFPYIVRKGDVFKVFIGHHAQRKAAERDNERLKKNGIESRVVTR